MDRKDNPSCGGRRKEERLSNLLPIQSIKEDLKKMRREMEYLEEFGSRAGS